MPARTASTAAISVHPSTPYSLSYLSEYAQTLDSLPLELSRNFADLRELDAVLSSAMAALNIKILSLIEMIENKTASKEQRLLLLHEIAEEATKMKLGGDDKIRVACQAADSLKSHSSYLSALLGQIHGLDQSVFIRKTTYPHVSPHAYSMNAPYESTRRRRAGNGSGLMVGGSTDPSPSKKRRVVQDDDFEFVNVRSPRKERTGEGQARNRGGGQRSRKNERAASPSESILSIASHVPLQNGAGVPAYSRPHNSSRANSNKRRQAAQNLMAANLGDTELSLDTVASRKEQHHVQAAASGVRNAAAAVEDAGPVNGHAVGVLNGQDLRNGDATALMNGRAGSAAVASLVAIADSGSVIQNASDVPLGEGEGDADNDDGRTYCICDGISFGEMIGCDDDNCERQWFHLGCIGLEIAPSGTWFCDECIARRHNKRSARGGKKKAGGRNGRGRAEAGP